jgi:ubiquinone/menaquinone biosynthesis C-methylase UbiE
MFGPAYAAVYDHLMAGLPYETWVDYLQDLADGQGCKLAHVLDLGCGTGSFALSALRRGLEVSCVDFSPWMLKQFKAKLASCPQRCRCHLVLAPLDQFRVDTSFDAAVCFFDTLNYLSNPSDFQGAILRASKALRSGGLFVFDLNTESAYGENLFDHSGAIPRGPAVDYTWRGAYCSAHRLYGLHLSFCESLSGKPLVEEFHLQRFYSDDCVRECLSRAGFLNVRRFHAFSMEEASQESQRLTYVAIKA